MLEKKRFVVRKGVERHFEEMQGEDAGRGSVDLESIDIHYRGYWSFETPFDRRSSIDQNELVDDAHVNQSRS